MHGLKPFACHLCEMRFAKAHGRDAHVREHLGIRPFNCEICFKGFSRRATMLQHQRSHTEEKKFQCQICLREYLYSTQLARHQKVHESSRPLQCKFCPNKYVDPGTFKRHLTVDHTTIKVNLSEDELNKIIEEAIQTYTDYNQQMAAAVDDLDEDFIIDGEEYETIVKFES